MPTLNSAAKTSALPEFAGKQVFCLTKQINLTTDAGLAALAGGDTINLFDVPAGTMVLGSRITNDVASDAGTSSTLTLNLGATAISAANNLKGAPGTTTLAATQAYSAAATTINGTFAISGAVTVKGVVTISVILAQL